MADADALLETRDLVKQFEVEGSRDVVHALSGSTNALIHLVAMAGLSYARCSLRG